jgi:hypothetical protein
MPTPRSAVIGLSVIIFILLFPPSMEDFGNIQRNCKILVSYQWLKKIQCSEEV